MHAPLVNNRVRNCMEFLFFIQRQKRFQNPVDFCMIMRFQLKIVAILFAFTDIDMAKHIKESTMSWWHYIRNIVLLFVSMCIFYNCQLLKIIFYLYVKIQSTSFFKRVTIARWWPYHNSRNLGAVLEIFCHYLAYWHVSVQKRSEIPFKISI